MTEQHNQWLLARPQIDAQVATDIAARQFGVAGEATELGSQQDRNYRISGDNGRLLLKFGHPDAPAEGRSLQQLVIDALVSAGVPTPQLAPPTGSGNREANDAGQVADAEPLTATTADGQTVAVRGFGWVDGAALEAEPATSGARAEQLGVLAGRTAIALAAAGTPLVDAAQAAAAVSAPSQWELGNALAVTEGLVHFLPEAQRSVCLDAARAADAAVRALAQELPSQVIHGDLTTDNVMRDADGVLWVIDLGDAGTSWRVAELAVTAADVLGRTGSIAAVARTVRGFADAVRAAGAPLTDAECQAIWPLIVLRGTTLAVSGWSQLDIDPDNDYARERMEHEWQVFARASAIDEADATAQLRLAAGLPHEPGLNYSPLLAGAVTVIDLGVESELLDRGAWLDADTESRLAVEALAAPGALAAQGAQIVAARFGEARLTRVPARVSEQAAPRARCVELWAAPGTEIRAPFAGTVRTVPAVSAETTETAEPTEPTESIELEHAGVVLRITGARVASASGPVAQGELLAVVGDASIRITRRVAWAQPESAFAAFHSEYETEGALDPSPLLGLGVERAADPELERLHEQQRRNHAMGGAAERFYVDPPRIERGWRSLLVETRGRAYLDMVNNVAAIGHSHPVLADRVARQLHLLNTNSRFLYRAYADFTEKLLSRVADPTLDVVIPVNSGSEALDLAIRMARVATGREGIVAAREGYHGWTMASDAVSTSAFDNPHALDSRPDWVHISDAPNAYRGPHRGADSGPAYVADLEAQLAELDAAGTPAAGFVCEPVIGNAGGVIPPAGYLAGAYDAIRAHGGLAIADEVQVGYGRLGHAFFGHEMLGARADIIAVAKAAGNAYPVGAVITSRAVVDALAREGMFFSSAGGAPASAIAATAVLDVIEDEGLQRNALEVGEYLQERLAELATRHPLIGTVHGTGLYQGVELVTDRKTLEPARDATEWVCEQMLHEGIIVQPASERQNVLKVKPPMTLTRDEAGDFIDALDRVLARVPAELR
ncbi:aminotransferase class III-fold pyridoxal phosphate-dependent enzyme [Leucobacter salsicius]|uniref:aminotransferase class III-fold pyridoxal phosphate-dependent enzyme n=1 Tax=Leucobacter salsicius TaxID=664638 RepID=UPI00034B7A06|nr:aminotransferase class III-fold pyridoxal phosphate-dependent enzyme [Leucobacter salsicius]